MKQKDESTALLKDYMSEMGYSEKEYLKVASVAYQKELSRNNVYAVFLAIQKQIKPRTAGNL